MKYSAHGRRLRVLESVALPLFCWAMWVMGGADLVRGAEVRAQASVAADAPSFILVHFGGKQELSAVASGVLFDIDGTGEPVRMPWPSQASNSWLVLDRNQNGRVD